MVLAGHFGCVYRAVMTPAEQKSHTMVAVKTLRYVDGERTFTNAFQQSTFYSLSFCGILQKNLNFIYYLHVALYHYTERKREGWRRALPK